MWSAATADLSSSNNPSILQRSFEDGNQSIQKGLSTAARTLRKVEHYFERKAEPTGASRPEVSPTRRLVPQAHFRTVSGSGLV